MGYDLHEEIAHGGMGVVYRARQRSLGRTVAVKMLLLGQFSSAENIQRFRREASAAAALQHPNIVAIHEVGAIDGQDFYSMDYVQGRSRAAIVGGVDVTRGWKVIGNDSEGTKERLTQIISKRGEVVHRAKGSVPAGQLPRHKVRKEELIQCIAFLRALVQAAEEALAKLSSTPRDDSPLQIAGNSQSAAVASPLFLAAQSSEAVEQMKCAFWSHMWPIIVYIFIAEGFITFLKLRKSKGNDGRRGCRRR